jgi:NADPH:quinone reductase
MKAVLVKALDRPEQFVIEEVAAKRAGPGEVVIAVRACGVNFPTGPWCREVSNQAAAAVCAGRRSLGPGQRAGREIPKIPLNLVLLKITSIVGVFWGAFAQARPEQNAANMAELLAWYAQGRLRPHVSGTFPLSGYREALDVVMNRKVKGKIVMAVD